MNNIPFERINYALKKEFGEGVVELRPCDWGDYPYVLRFQEDRPPSDVVERAKVIVGRVIPTSWDHSAARVVK